VYTGNLFSASSGGSRLFGRVLNKAAGAAAAWLFLLFGAAFGPLQPSGASSVSEAAFFGLSSGRFSVCQNYLSTRNNRQILTVPVTNDDCSLAGDAS